MTVKVILSHKKVKRVTEFVQHGDWSHAGKPNKHCELCQRGIGFHAVYLKPMRRRHAR